jgi:hypothetical protein
MSSGEIGNKLQVASSFNKNMTTINLTLSPELEQRLRTEALKQGLEPDLFSIPFKNAFNQASQPLNPPKLIYCNKLILASLRKRGSSVIPSLQNAALKL